MLSFILAAAMTVNMAVVPVAGAEVIADAVVTETVVDENAEEVVVIDEAVTEEVIEEDEITVEEIAEEEAIEESSVEALDSEYVLSAEQKADKEALAASLDDVFGVAITGMASTMSEASIASAAADNGIYYEAGEVVYMTDSEADAKKVAKLYGGTLESYSNEIAVIKLANGTSVASAVMSAASADTNLPMVSPNYKYKLFDEYETAATDPYIEEGSPKYQWFLDFVGAKDAWAKGYTGRGIKVAVLDSGINTEHVDLASNTTPGKAFFNGRKGDEFSGDTDEHGTHVAGIIAADDNGLLGCGVAPDATVTSFAVFNGNSGSSSDITRAVNAVKSAGSYNLINMSLGGYGKDTTFEKACKGAADSGVVIICAAGNDNTDRVSYPAGFSSCISIASLQKDGTRSSFSNYGSTVDYCFPGSSIYSCNAYDVEEYQNMSGTSMATPCAVGVAAVIMQANPDIAATKSSAATTKLKKIMTEAAFKSPSSSKYKIGVGTTYLPTALGVPSTPIGTPVSSIEITGPQSIHAGSSFTVSCKVLPEDATNKNIRLQYKELDKHISIKGNKITTSKKANGTYTIYASSADGAVFNVPFTFEVTKGYITKISLDKKKMKLYTEAGKSGAPTSYALTATVKGKSNYNENAYTFVSSNPLVATVDENGNVSAVAPGTVKITCKATDGTKAKAVCTVKVYRPMSGVKIGSNGDYNLSQITVKRGKKCKLSVQAETSYGTPTSTKVKWVSDNKKITVSQSGVVTVSKKAKSGDTATITVKAADGSGVSATITVNVE